MRLLRIRFTTRRLMIASACLLSAYVGAVVWASRKPDRDALRHQESTVIEALGGAHATGGLRLLGRHDTLLTRFTGAISRHDEAALRAIDGAGPTLAEKIAASRGPLGEPAELALGPGVPVADLERRLGPPSSRSVVKYPWIGKSVEFSTYGNLDVGVLDGKTILVRVR